MTKCIFCEKESERMGCSECAETFAELIEAMQRLTDLRFVLAHVRKIPKLAEAAVQALTMLLSITSTMNSIQPAIKEEKKTKTRNKQVDIAVDSPPEDETKTPKECASCGKPLPKNWVVNDCPLCIAVRGVQAEQGQRG
jgi:hypothetical protein